MSNISSRLDLGSRTQLEKWHHKSDMVSFSPPLGITSGDTWHQGFQKQPLCQLFLAADTSPKLSGLRQIFI